MKYKLRFYGVVEKEADTISEILYYVEEKFNDYFDSIDNFNRWAELEYDGFISIIEAE